MRQLIVFGTSLVFGALLLFNAGAADGSRPPIPAWQPDAAQREHLRRSLTLLQSSTPTDRKTVRVLFYGQSITQQGWWKEVEHHLRTTYSNANLIIENRAIGGHASQLLVKTAEADLYPFQPDLLIFHVYGSHIDYENIIRRVRERTCADILLQTDHITRDEALNEEADPSKLSPKQWDPWMNYVFLPQTAAQFGACRADIHALWKTYLRTNNLKAAELLRDGVHLNGHGEWLLAEFLKRYLDPLPAKPGYNPEDSATVRTVALAPSAGGKFEFTGSRVDLVFKPGVSNAVVSVVIDGTKPSSIPELQGFTRVSAFPNSDWPILLKADKQAPLLTEEWSLQIAEASADGRFCRFKLTGSVSGADGEGTSTNRFISNSGRVVICPEDWNLEFCARVFKRALPEGHAATWRAVVQGTDVAQAPAPATGVESVVTIAQGLSPGKHQLELRGADISKQLQAIRIYSPPGK